MKQKQKQSTTANPATATATATVTAAPSRESTRGQGKVLNLVMLAVFLACAMPMLRSAAGVDLVPNGQGVFVLQATAAKGSLVRRQASSSTASSSSSTTATSASSSASSSGTTTAATATGTANGSASASSGGGSNTNNPAPTNVSVNGTVTGSTNGTAANGTATAGGNSTIPSGSGVVGDNQDDLVIDPLTPAGTATFLVPVTYASVQDMTIFPIGEVMRVQWAFQNLALPPKLITVQVNNPAQAKKLTGSTLKKPEDRWQPVAVNISGTATSVNWTVNVPDGQGYQLRLFDSDVGPALVGKPGRLAMSTSSKFNVYLGGRDSSFAYTHAAAPKGIGAAAGAAIAAALTAAGMAAVHLL
ncbi:hypothetical protein H9P43_004742 [Blastocladiella emersonii ATCC 22665]|nr:hypothetical protein H9P43_004742 [Blastocladiella emersonii ATCC 22665]